MRVVLQRVKEASVTVSGDAISRIGPGFVLLVGIAKGDDKETVQKTAEKIAKLRVFEDVEGKMNLDINQVSGQILSVPQFTLLGNTDKGNSPGFDNAALPDEAKALWLFFNDILRKNDIIIAEGSFGAHMEVALVNDGPVTFVI